MASLKDLRERIGSVESTQKITKAMQMVAAAKFRRAQTAVEAARPYLERFDEVMKNISANLAGPDKPSLMRGTGKDNVHLVVVCTADRGLCGGFNIQIVREAREYLHARLNEGKQVQILTVGAKGAEMLQREFGKYFTDKVDLGEYKHIGFEQARLIADELINRYEDNQFDVCTLFYSEFHSAIKQVPQAQQIIPYGVNTESEAQDSGTNHSDSQAHASVNDENKVTAYCEYEPNAAEIVSDLVPRGLATQIFRALLENVAGEMGAKMTAMDNATRNADTMIDQLSISYNRQRQARITTELIEIIAGAEAL